MYSWNVNKSCRVSQSTTETQYSVFDTNYDFFNLEYFIRKCDDFPFSLTNKGFVALIYC